MNESINALLPRGFGFILPDDGSADLFFDVRDLVDRNYEPRPGERVLFDQRRSRRHDGKLEAFNVAIV